jgi:nicotinate-nucleotide adenylyltransferase
MRRIGILGGTFDPIHRGHVDLGIAAQRALGLQQVLVMPASLPPHRDEPIASSFHRFAMVAMAIADYAGWQASEFELRQNSPSYTSSTLARLHDKGYQPQELFFLTGADAFSRIETWKNYPTLLDAAHFAVVSRPGHSVEALRAQLPALAPRMIPPSEDPSPLRHPAIILINAPTLNTSSTEIRLRCARGQSIEELVDPRVQQHIARHGLYASVDADRRAHDLSQHPAAGRLHGQS